MHASAALSGQQIHVLMFSYVFFSGVVLIAWLLFASSMSKAMRLVSREQRVLPRFFLWLTVLVAISYALSWVPTVPLLWQICAFLGLVFSWMVLPFGLPKSLKRIAGNDDAANKQVDMLFSLGLANQICMLIVFLLKLFVSSVEPSSAISFGMTSMGNIWSTLLAIVLAIISVGLLVTWVFYWCKVVSIRKMLKG